MRSLTSNSSGSSRLPPTRFRNEPTPRSCSAPRASGTLRQNTRSSHRRGALGGYSGRLSSTQTLGARTLVDFFLRSYLKQVVSIHQAMFDKLLFAEDTALGPDLAELFEDVGKTYLLLSERITEKSSLHSLQD